jgi:hypothetical protein
MTRIKLVFVVLLVLALQNVLFFFRHYFQGYAFPWDFCLTYHAVPYYWIELAKLDIDTSWVPFAGMGYPLFMNLQSGFFYPFFWWFVVFDQTYTIHAAVIMEGIHVLLGAVGAVVCAKLLGLDWKQALFTGVMYQGFGGFYSNAEHPDIVRSYALIPWMIAPVFADWSHLKQSNLLKISIAILPFIVYCEWSGGYPGITIAALFMVGTIVFTRLIFSNDRKVGITILAACVAGTLLAAIFLLPLTMQVSEIARASSTPNTHFDYLVPSDIFGLVYSTNNPYFAHDVSMRSTFVGIPVMALVFIGLIDLRCKVWNKWVIFSFGLALLMSTGLLHTIVVKVLPPIGLSRFTMADYRAFIALAIVLLSASTLQTIQHTKTKDGYIWAVALLLFLWIGDNALNTNGGTWFSDRIRMFSVLVATIVVLRLSLYSKKTLWVVLALIIITLFDWSRVHWSESYFAMGDGQAYCETASNRISNRKLLDNRLRDGNGCRTARVNNPGTDFAHFSWRGYYSGEYMMQDCSGSMQFKRQQKILSDSSLMNFSALPWRMVAVPNETQINTMNFQGTMLANVKCMNYGTTEIRHVVDISAPGLVVENELYWLGWEAKLINLSSKNPKVIKAVDVNGFRGWYLPAGKYDMVETYKTPYKNSSLSLTFFGLFIWLCILCILWKHRMHFKFKRDFL